MAPTRVVRRTKRAFRREERVFRRRIIKAMMEENRCAVCKRRGKKLVFWISAKKWSRGLYDDVILKWRRICWRCGRRTPVVWRAKVTKGWDEESGEPVGVEDEEEFYQEEFPHKSFLIKASKIFPFVRRTYSKTLGEFVYGNCCIHCGAYQGNFFVSAEFPEVLRCRGWERLWKKPEWTRNTPEEAIYYFGERKVKEFEKGVKLLTHHISYNPEKTITVCTRCHNQIHHTDKYPHLKPSQKRPKSRKKKEEKGEGGEKRKREVKEEPKLPFPIYRGMAGKKRRIFVPIEN